MLTSDTVVKSEAQGIPLFQIIFMTAGLGVMVLRDGGVLLIVRPGTEAFGLGGILVLLAVFAPTDHKYTVLAQ